MHTYFSLNGLPRHLLNDHYYLCVPCELCLLRLPCGMPALWNFPNFREPLWGFDRAGLFLWGRWEPSYWGERCKIYTCHYFYFYKLLNYKAVNLAKDI